MLAHVLEGGGKAMSKGLYEKVFPRERRENGKKKMERGWGREVSTWAKKF